MLHIYLAASVISVINIRTENDIQAERRKITKVNI